MITFRETLASENATGKAVNLFSKWNPLTESIRHLFFDIKHWKSTAKKLNFYYTFICRKKQVRKSFFTAERLKTREEGKNRIILDRISVCYLYNQFGD